MITKIMECDLLVLGAGGSGLVAGTRAFDLTGKKVLILEKAKKPAGCTYFASGMGESGPITDSTWQKDAGFKINEDPQDLSGQFFDWLVTATTQAEAEKMFSVVKAGGDTNTFWRAGRIKNLERTEKYKDLPDHSIGPGRMGSWVVDHLTDYCKKKGITLLTETRARKFIKDDKGKVTACIADTNDGQLVINFKACVIAAGGYGANKELLKKYYPKEFGAGGKMHSLCPPYMTGDCILAAEDVGAYIDPTIRGISFPGGFYGDGTVRHPWSPGLLTLATGKCVMINLNGKRWKNEAGMGGGDLAAQPDGVWAAIVDSDLVEAAASQKDNMRSMMGEAERDLKADLEWEAAMDDAGASGNHTRKADTFVELALKMKIDPRAFVDTMERYNKFCETGKDPDFGKSAQMLQPIKKPPFYAVFGNRWSQSTKGRNGIAVNSRFQVLDAKGEVMPGLYASGDGCTIFGGFIIGASGGAMGDDIWTAEEKVARTALSRALAQAFSSSSAGTSEAGGPGMMGAPGAGGAPGGQGGAQGSGGSRSQGNMQMMGGGAQDADILKGKGSPCGGLGPAFLSGFCAGTFAAKYVKNL
jgi:succinate dehydrogenase/fumarate reductase flavoprotein subunit